MRLGAGLQEIHGRRKLIVSITISILVVLHPVPPVARLPVFPHGGVSEEVDVLAPGHPSVGSAAVSREWGWKASETSAGPLLR